MKRKTRILQETIVRLGTSMLVVCSVFFLVFSCNQVEFYSHARSSAEHHQTKSECHLSTFSTTHNQNSILLFILLLLALNSLFLKRNTFSVIQIKSLQIKLILFESPPRVFNIIAYLFSKGILHSKLF